MPEPVEAAVMDAPVEAVVDTPAVDTAAVDTPTADTPAEVAADQPTVDTPQEDAEGDGRVIPQNLRTLLGELNAKDPKLGKQLKGLFFQDRVLKQNFPGGVPEAIKAREAIDSLGGEEGIQAINSEREEWAALDTQFEQGDPKFIENIAAESPEGFAKLVPVALDKLGQTNPEQYQHLAGRIIHNALANAEFVNAVRALKSAAADPAKVAAICDDMEKWAGEIRDLATRVPERKIDPERQKLDAEKKTFEEQKFQTFQASVMVDATTHIEAGIERELTAQLKTKGVDVAKLKKTDPESYSLLVKNVDGEIGKALNANKVFVSQRNAMLQGMDKEKLLKFIKPNIDKVLPDAAKRVARAFYATTPTQKPQVAQPTSSSQTVAPGKLNKAPLPEQIDRSRTTNDMIYDNKAFIKGRKDMVTWG